jgi:hypothetical protein
MQTTTCLLSAVLLTANLAVAQAPVTVRDTIYALPPFSTCMDGATHATTATGHRLRPGAFNLKNFLGKPVEITGTRGGLARCPNVTVTAIRTLAAGQSSTPSSTSTQVKVEFYGTANNVYALYAGALAKSALRLPGINGPIHIHPGLFVFLGVFTPSGSSKPYLTLTAPNTPAVRGVNFYDQAISVGATGNEMTNVDVFKL